MEANLVWTRTEAVTSSLHAIEYTATDDAAFGPWTHPSYQYAGVSSSYPPPGFPPPSIPAGSSRLGSFAVSGERYVSASLDPNGGLLYQIRRVTIRWQTNLPPGVKFTLPNNFEDREFNTGSGWLNDMLPLSPLIWGSTGEEANIYPHTPNGFRNVAFAPPVTFSADAQTAPALSSYCLKPRSSSTVELLHPWATCQWPADANVGYVAYHQVVSSTPPPQPAEFVFTPIRRALVRSSRLGSVPPYIGAMMLAGQNYTVTVPYQQVKPTVWVAFQTGVLPTATVTTPTPPPWAEFITWVGPAVWRRDWATRIDTPMWLPFATSLYDGMPRVLLHHGENASWYRYPGALHLYDSRLAGLAFMPLITYGSFNPPVILALHDEP